MPSFQHRSPAKGSGTATEDAGNNLNSTGDAHPVVSRSNRKPDIRRLPVAVIWEQRCRHSPAGCCLGSSSLLDEAYSLGAFGCIYTQDIDALGEVCGADAVALGVAAKHAVD